MTKGIIYYTDNRLTGPILELSQASILAAGLPVVSCSLQPMEFGEINIVLRGLERGYDTMVRQILAALKLLETDTVFFCEHDVLYHPSHFALRPEQPEIYYYNVNNWRWLFPEDHLISYSGLTSLSMMFCRRELALAHYQYRHDHIQKFGLYKDKAGSEPKWGRLLGYEPGTKRRRRGGLTDEEHSRVRSALPNIDIRHDLTFSRPKVRPHEFKHVPPDLVEAGLDDIPGWDLRFMFGLTREGA